MVMNMPLRTLKKNMYSPITSSISFNKPNKYDRYTAYNMFISLMPGSNSSSYALKKNLEISSAGFYLSIHELFQPPDINRLNFRQSFWKISNKYKA